MKFDVKEIRFAIAQKYGIPESEIDESVLAICLIIDKKNEESIALLKDQKAAISQSLDEIKQLQAKKFKSVTYEDPKTAFWGNFGSKGIIGVCCALALIVVSSTISSWYENRELVQNLQVLKAHVQVTEDGYVIKKDSYIVTRDGILIKP
ncbi:hypothetical protein GCM10007423_63780 [Dyadobacter endophyticus]|uniref:Anti-sigma factor n=1 Tax=Dyadobacter endophyticus TaxID=1749036 RepID=A0ABQ1ZAU8_9BACT|nr:hypothetical protein [Dyadobacter endophyticus]GGH55813.1 hypothetical protein GCM10007423_63780 [Dyadobacter endophyticus]